MSVALFCWIVAAVWFACGVATYGFVVAHYQRQFWRTAQDRKYADRVYAGFAAVTGPIGLAAAITCGQFRQGWML